MDPKIMIPALLIIVPISVYLGWPAPGDHREERVAHCEAALADTPLPADDRANMCSCVVDEQIDRGISVLDRGEARDAHMPEIMQLCVERHDIDGIV